MFDPVDPKQSFPEMEKGILQYWKEEAIFQRSLELREGREIFSFYDGPPFATGLPHYGHLIGGTIKDVIPRYQTMRGKYVERRFGWDCHGLPVEYEIEKEHNIGSKRDIEAMGVAAFNALCRTAVQRYTREWRTTVERMGRFVDMDYDYRTMDPEYMESIWWVVSQLHEKGLLYEGHKPMHICPRCVTPLSNFEVTQGYKDITDQSATVRFRVKEAEETDGTEDAKGETYILAWTTTPWTLPGNLFLAVGEDIEYVKVSHDGNTYILAKDRVETVFKDKEHAIEGKAFKGKKLVGMQYAPLFPYFTDRYGEGAFRVVDGDFVSTEEGTGIVHIAPGFGEDDYKVGKRENVALLQHVTPEGTFVPHVTDFAGMDVKPIDDPAKTDRKVADWLEKKGLLFSREAYRHSYPHCWRCDSPLLNYATSSWFVAIEKIKEDMLRSNAQTEWVPSHVRDGRFGKWLEGARDWAISRNRYWGTPLPLWRSSAESSLTVISSREDLFRRKRMRFTRVSVLRHAESEGNITHVYQGNVPGTNLTERGKAQARKAGEELQESGLAVIYCSPLARTRQTAEEVAKATGATLIVDERLREVDFGNHEGKTIDLSDLAIVKAKRAKKFADGSPESIYHLPGMESWVNVQKRMDAFLAEILPKHRSDHIAIVTHADPLMNVRHFFTREDPFKLSHQPYPHYATPETFYWDHRSGSALDLHKEIVDELRWPGEPTDASAKVTLVRHGETDWNAKNLVQGSERDEPLNTTGRAQLQALAKKLKGERFDIVLSSHLIRAVESATILKDALGLADHRQWKELRERDLGEWTGQAIPDVLKNNPPPFEGVNPAMHHFTPTGGEGLTAFLTRAEEAYRMILKQFPGKRVLIVAHGGFIQAFRTIAENLDYQGAIAVKPTNGEAVHLSIDPMEERVPEVLDCWFESGSMPYAQSHYPFERPRRQVRSIHEGAHQSDSSSGLTTTPSPLPPGFPADFIAEGMDQTRGWFYTLMVLSSALFRKPAFHHCIVNGIVLAEDGRKMSKRLKNYPEPAKVIDAYGADALRFALMSSPAVRGEDLRFSEKIVVEVVRSVLLPLWNSYSFFVTYANAATFAPTASKSASSHPLDRYLRCELQDLTNRMTAELDNYDLSGCCNELHESIDALTNWYIRLSRRRFAGKGGIDAPEDEREDNEEGQVQALETLHQGLITICQLLAPFCPFVTEAIYLNLTGEEHDSVHLTDWPEPRALSREERRLLDTNRLLRLTVSLGLTVRSEQKIALRSPLQKATIVVPASLLKNAPLSDEDLDLLRQELNVKEIAFADDPKLLAEAYAQVDARKVGPRLGKRVQEIIAAGKQGEFTRNDDGSVMILDESLGPDEVQIIYRGREGEGVAADKGVVVSLDTRITDELRLEGNARTLIRSIQKLRKDAGLSHTDTITLAVEGADDLLKKHGELIAQETRAVLGDAEGPAQTVDLDETQVTVRFAKRTS